MGKGLKGKNCWAIPAPKRRWTDESMQKAVNLFEQNRAG